MTHAGVQMNEMPNYQSPATTTVVDAPPAPPSPSSPKAALLPDLSKETWEYLELKLWTSFSKKIWVLVTSVVTILGLLASLGLNAWVQAKVDTALSGEKERFLKAVADYQTRSEATLTLAAVAFHIRQRETQDVQRYVAMANEVKASFPDSLIKTVVDSKELGDLLWPIKVGGYGGFVAVRSDAVKKAVAPIAKALVAADATKFEQSLVELAQASRHILAVREMSRATGKLLFTQAQTDPARLVKLYEEQILPTYVDALKKSGEFSIWVTSGERKVSSLFPSGQMEFNFVVPSYMEKVFDEDKSKK
jgi:hypothetical protein